MSRSIRWTISLLRGALVLALVLWAVATATFLLMKAVPGGPLSTDRKLPVQIEAAIRARYHLDEPLWKQYARYLGDAARGDFGPSYHQQGRSVGEIIARQSPVSAQLGLLALGMALALAFPLGVAAAARPDGWADRLNAFVGAAGVSVPSFILGAVLLYWFSYKFGWFPSSGWRGMSTAILPALALAALPTAYLARLVRSELREVLGSEFLLTARAKGLSGTRVIVVHALRHTLSPVLAYLGPQAAAVMTGSFVVERIFDVPGLGREFVRSISNRDYPLIMGVTLFYTVVLVFFNLLADAAARGLDPRQRQH
jgi:oligopeptide transport system permease protein